MLLKEPKVLLVYPPNQLMDIETPRPDGSLGPLYLAGALRDAGFEVDVLDASVGGPGDSLDDTFRRVVRQPNGLMRIGMSPERIREVVSRGGYNVVGINSNFTPQTRMVLEMAHLVREVNPDALVITGGVNARNMVPRLMSSSSIDLICTTEGERVVVDIVQKWSKGESLKGVPGTVCRNGANGYKLTPPQVDTVITDLDQLPVPAWELLPLDKYEKIAAPHGDISTHGQHRYAPIMTSRGCPFRCTYCHISTEKDESGFSGDIGSLRLKSVERVISEIDRIQDLGIKKLYFEDDSMLAKKWRVKAIFEQVVSRGLIIANVNGVNLVHLFVKSKRGGLEIDRDYLELLKAAGFSVIVFPVESASQRILDKYATAKLDHSRTDVVKLVETAVEVGIVCPINMMIGFPDETEAEIYQSIDLGRRLVDAGAHYCTFFIPIPFPGSCLYETAIKSGYLDPGFDPDLMNWKNPVMKNTTVSPERLVELREWAWRTVNRRDYVEARLKENMGSRWSSGAISRVSV
ncbi:MAG: radical SAM protein [Minisyncoccia bacterium]